MIYEFSKDIEYDKKIESKVYYSKTYLQSIKSNEKLKFKMLHF